MRIDEFSAPGLIDASFSLTERTRFVLFGFDIPLSVPLSLVGIEIISAVLNFYKRVLNGAEIQKQVNGNTEIQETILAGAHIA